MIIESIWRTFTINMSYFQLNLIVSTILGLITFLILYISIHKFISN